jgi:hypothetical protein
MLKKTFLRAAVFGLLFVAGAVGAFAQRFTVGGGLALAATDVDVRGVPGGNPSIDSEVGFGGNIYVDYRLPVRVPVSLGAEIGVMGAKFEAGSYEDTVTAVPLLLRVAYHFDNLVENLDLYIAGKIGGAFGSWKGDYKDYAKNMGLSVDDPGGFAFGFDVGAVYFVTPIFGLFAELGFDRYALETEATGELFGEKIKVTLEAPFSRFLTFGVSFRPGRRKP